MSPVSVMVVEALKTLGKNNIDENIVAILKKKINAEEKSMLLKETTDSAAWIFDVVRRVCE
jgi:arsenate reductase-like glutaredoxin family protein